MQTRHDFRQRLASEQGAALIQVGIAILVLTGLTAFVLDQGVMWLARRQAQNAADAGALAGAVASAYDETADPPADDGIAFNSAVAAAQANRVIQEAGGVTVSWECPAFAAGSHCVRVDVVRDGTNDSNELPTFFANVFGVTAQSVRATATARAGAANATDCLRPFAVPDLWLDFTPASVDNPTGVFHRYEKNGPDKGKLMANPDSYSKPGYTVGANLGHEVTLKFGNPSGSDPMQPGWYMPIDVPREDGPIAGGDKYNENIASCNGVPVSIGDHLLTESGAKIGPTKFGIGDLIDLDPDADWDPDTETVEGSCAPECAPFSPRIITLAVYDADLFDKWSTNSDWSLCPGGGSCVEVVNFLGFFVDRMVGNDVIGYLIKNSGAFTTVGDDDPAEVDEDAAFLQVIQLIR